MLVETKISDYLQEYDIEWANELPSSIPPEDVLVPQQHVLYRMSKDEIIQEADLTPFYFKDKEKYGKMLPCSSGLSVFDNEESAKRKMKLPMLRCLSQITLSATDGVVVNSFSEHHYTWWRTKSFDKSTAVLISTL